MQNALNVNADLFQIVQVVDELEEMRLLQPPRTLNLVDFAFAALQKVDFDSSDADFFKLARVTLLVQKFAQQDQVWVSLKSEIMRKKPQLTTTNKIVVNLSTSVRKAIL